jgi:hypothetical protein
MNVDREATKQSHAQFRTPSGNDQRAVNAVQGSTRVAPTRTPYHPGTYRPVDTGGTSLGKKSEECIYGGCLVTLRLCHIRSVFGLS